MDYTLSGNINACVMYGNRCVLSASKDGSVGGGLYQWTSRAAEYEQLLLGRIRDYIKVYPETGGPVGFMFLR